MRTAWFSFLWSLGSVRPSVRPSDRDGPSVRPSVLSHIRPSITCSEDICSTPDRSASLSLLWLVPSQRLRALAGPVGCRGPGCSVRRYVAWLRSAESGARPCSGRLMTPAAGWRAASMSIQMYQHRRSLPRRPSGTMARLSARLIVQPVVRLVVARSMVRLVARPVYLRRSPAAPGP